MADRTRIGVVLRLSDIVDRDVVSLSRDMPLADGIELMRRSRVEIAPVLHTGKVVGVVSLRALESSTNQSSLRIRDVTPGSYATYQALAPETELDTAFELAREAGAEFVLVLDQGRLIGIVPTWRIEVSMGASPPT